MQCRHLQGFVSHHSGSQNLNFSDKLGEILFQANPCKNVHHLTIIFGSSKWVDYNQYYSGKKNLDIGNKQLKQLLF